MAKKKDKKPTATTEPKGTKVTREISIEIADDKERLAKLGKEEGALLRNLAKLDANFAEVKSEWAARLDPLRSRLGEIRQALKDERETFTADTVMVKNYDANKIEYWFDGKIVDARDMTAEERQQDIGFPKNTRKGRAPRVDHKMAAANDVEREDADIGNVRRLETSRHTKHSATDGPAGNGVNGREVEGKYTPGTPA
jgi:predicted nuclease with TOPRIM domain